MVPTYSERILSEVERLRRDLSKMLNRATLFVSIVWLCLATTILAYSAWEIRELRKQIETFCDQIIEVAEHEGLDLLKKVLEDVE